MCLTLLINYGKHHACNDVGIAAYSRDTHGCEGCARLSWHTTYLDYDTRPGYGGHHGCNDVGSAAYSRDTHGCEGQTVVTHDIP